MSAIVWTRNAALAMVVGVVGCGGAQASSYNWADTDETTGQAVNIRQGAMPASQTYTGVYRSSQIGDVQIDQTGDSAIGEYEYDRGSCHVRGHIEGSISGNLFRFNWREDHRACGRIEPVRGRGYFLYAMDDSGEVRRARLFGRWGYGDNEREGGPWTAFKLPGRSPTFNREGSSGGEGEQSGEGSGDSSGGQSGSTGDSSGQGGSGSNPAGGL